ncbi:MAG TPA: S41 family peptidase [Blastocatellia bacterium]|nr:S41 family peptidase [Blastocatellia bacterium]
MKNKYWLLALALILPLTFAGAHPMQRSAQSLDEAEARKRIANDFAEALLLAQEKSASTVDYDRAAKASINGMLRTLDPHSMYFDAKQWEEFQNDQRSRYYGIGSAIIQRNGKVYIWAPTEGTASYRAGLRYGDHIIAINGESTEGLNQSQVRSKLIGPDGTQVVVKVDRLGVGPLEFKLTRGAVPLPSLSNAFMLSNGIGYINLDRGFNTTTYDEVRRAIADLRQQGMTSLVFDLRLNHGGLVDQAWRVSNLFLYQGQKILSMRGRPTIFPNRDYTATNPAPDDYPIVVLISRETASAAEIVAGALQDHDRARLVGENSFGKGLVQNPFPLKDGSALILTTGHYYTPSGRLIQRDYSGRSFYDYYLKRGDKDAVQRTEEKKTDTGRTVYGGGGIDPDVVEKVRQSPKELEMQRAWFEPVFEFARVLVAGQVPGFADFKIDHPADHHHRLQPVEFQVSDKLLAAFKTFVTERKDLKADLARLDREGDFLKRWIRYELVTAAYGTETAYQVLLESDNQVQRAISEIPKARVMAEDARRSRTGRNNE